MPPIFILADNHAQYLRISGHLSDCFGVNTRNFMLVNEHSHSRSFLGMDGFIVVECDGYFDKLPHRSYTVVAERLEIQQQLMYRRGVLWLVEQDFYRARAQRESV